MSLPREWRYKLRRLRRPRPLKHLALADPRFALRAAPDAPGVSHILWKGRVAGQTRPLSEVRGAERGDCFIVCTGPSLDEIDFGLLRGRATLGVNGAIHKFQEHGFSPDYYAVVDTDFFESRFPLVERAIRGGAKFFTSFAGLSRICERKPELLGRTAFYLHDLLNTWYARPRMPAAEFDAWAAADADLLLHPDHPLRGGLIVFSKYLATGAFCGQTVAFRATQIAYYLGFRRVFLLGMDLGGAARFYESGRAARRSNLDRHFEDFIRPAFECAREICRREPFEIYNLSPRSRLPESVIPKLSLEDALRMGAESP
jgi:KDO transferase-3